MEIQLEMYLELEDVSKVKKFSGSAQQLIRHKEGKIIEEIWKPSSNSKNNSWAEMSGTLVNCGSIPRDSFFCIF